MAILSSALFSFFISLALIPILTRVAVARGIGLDKPDARKVHTAPIPRVGGVAIAVSVYAVVLPGPVHESRFVVAFAIAAAVVIAAGLLDDVRGAGFRVKFLAQIAAALLMVFYGNLRIHNLGGLLPDGWLLPDFVAIPLTVIAIVGVTNAVNLSDGLDGLAGGICLLSFCSLGYLAYLDGNLIVTLLSVALAGSLFGFLRYNTYPANLFLGDTGSQLLGFSAITLSLDLTQGATPLSPLLPLLVLGFPVLDTVTVMAQRISERRPLFAPDRNHFHHRLMGFGLPHAEAVLIIYVIQVLLVVGAYLLRFRSEWLILSTYALFSAAILLAFHGGDTGHLNFRRYDLIEKLFARPLRSMRERGLFIRVTFRTLQVALPLLLFTATLLPRNIPGEFSVVSIVWLALLLAAQIFKPAWMRGALMFVLYPFVPILMVLSVSSARDIQSDLFPTIGNLFFVAVVVLAVLTLRFTRRTKGFKATPTDFLILFLALVFPYLLANYIPFENPSMAAVRIIVLFFGYEVLIGELRTKVVSLSEATIPSLAMIVFRGLAGW